ncbi:MAG: hypothetical protein ABJ208_01540, partial [Rhodopirellula bahusiensis]
MKSLCKSREYLCSEPPSTRLLSGKTMRTTRAFQPSVSGAWLLRFCISRVEMKAVCWQVLRHSIYLFRSVSRSIGRATSFASQNV